VTIKKKSFAGKIAAAALAFNLAAGGVAWAATNALASVEQAAISQSDMLTSRFSAAIDPLVPVEAIAGMGALYGAFCLFAARRKMKGTWLRVGAGSVMALMLLNPMVIEEKHEDLPTDVLIVVDKSKSQELGGRTEVTGDAYKALSKELKGMDGIHVRTIEVDQTKSAEGTHLFDALETDLEAASPGRLGAVIMLTDGLVHDVPKSTRIPKDVPLHMLLSGTEQEIDRRIVIDKSPHFGLVNKEQIISFRVLDEGKDAQSQPGVRVSITHDGKEIQSKVVTPGQVVKTKLNIPHSGTNIIELKAEPLVGELTEINNRVVTSIEGVRENMNVLFLSGSPNAGVRMWRGLLKSDSESNFVHFTFLRERDSYDRTRRSELSLIEFPMRELFEEKINDFDLIVLDNYKNQDFFPDVFLEYIADYVEQGGALLTVAGADYAGRDSLYKTPLGEVLSARPTGNVIETPYTPHVSDQGKKHPVTRDLGDETKWGRWFRTIEAKAESGDVLMSGADGKPLLVLERSGKGRTALMLSDHAWLWARGYEGGGPYAKLLHKTAHWLMKNPGLEEEALRITQEDKSLVIEQQTMSDKSSAVTVRTPSGKTVTVQPESKGNGIWTATIPADELGVYSAEQKKNDSKTTLQAVANVGSIYSKEYSETISTSSYLKPVVESSKGQIVRMQDDKGRLPLPRVAFGDNGTTEKLNVKKTDASILKGVHTIPLVPAWAGMAMIVGLLGAAWYREGDHSKKNGNDSGKAAPQP